MAVFAHAAGARFPWGKDYLPNVEVIDQDGRPLKFYDDLLKGKLSSSASSIRVARAFAH